MLGEDMSGSAEGVCPAISNAITNLYGNQLYKDLVLFDYMNFILKYVLCLAL